MLKPSIFREKIINLLEQFEVACHEDAQEEMIRRLKGKAQTTPPPINQTPTLPLDVEKISAKLLTYIQGNPKQTITEMSKGLGVEVDMIRKPLKTIFLEGKVRRVGTGKGVRYTMKRTS